MNNSIAVGEGQCGCYVDSYISSTVWVERTFGSNDFGQAPAFDVLHDDVVSACFLTPVVNTDHIWLIQVRGGLCFSAKPFDERRVRRVFGEQDLYSYRPV